MTPDSAPTSGAGPVEIVDHLAPAQGTDVRVRAYAPVPNLGDRVGLVWAHGGGFAWGDLDMPEAHWFCSTLAAHGIPVISVDYRRAPVPAEWTTPGDDGPRPGVHAPVPAIDVAEAFRWAEEHGPRARAWALGGASAGGNLATSAALQLLAGELGSGSVPVRELDPESTPPKLLLLAYPTLHPAPEPAPEPALAHKLEQGPHPTPGPVTAEHRSDRTKVRTVSVAAMYANYLGGEEPDIYSAPGVATAGQLAGLPPTHIILSEHDELRGSAAAFATKLVDAGVELHIATEPGTSHGHLNRPDAAGAMASVARVLRIFDRARAAAD